MTSFSLRSGLAPLCAMLLLLGLLAGCTRVAPVRTLPSWVRGIYVPMVKNKSFEPGLEEQATKAIQEAFIQDGRVDIVPKQDADLVLVATVMDWKGRTSRSEGNHVSTDEGVTMLVDLKLFEPLNMEQPLADLGHLSIINSFNIDVRSVDFLPEPDRRERLMDNLGTRVLNQVINGFPVQLRNAPPGALFPVTQNVDQIQSQKPLEPRTGSDEK